jgi:hypothetical protein
MEEKLTMPEPRKPMLCARVATSTLERAIERLPLNRYPVRLAVIDRELARRAAEERRRLLAKEAA